MVSMVSNTLNNALLDGPSETLQKEKKKILKMYD